MKIFIDFDGVLLNTNDLVMIEIIKEIHDDGLNEIFEEINWEKLYKNAPIINNNIQIIKDLQNTHDITIITKIKHLNEGIAKINYLKEKGIHVPIILVPIYNSKTDLITPKKNYLLIDDDIKNIKEWGIQAAPTFHYKKIDDLNAIIINTLID